MKAIILLIISFTTNTTAHALILNSEVTCKDGICIEKNAFQGLPEYKLQFSELQINLCLVEPKTDNFFRIIDKQYSTKIILVSIKNEDDYLIELSREVIFTDSREFNTNLKIINCRFAPSILSDEESFKKCEIENNKTSSKWFCIKQRIRNF